MFGLMEQLFPVETLCFPEKIPPSLTLQLFSIAKLKIIAGFATLPFPYFWPARGVP